MIGIEYDRHPRRWGIRRLSFVAALAATFFPTPSKAEEGPPGQAVVFNETNANSQGERHPGSIAWRIVRTTAVGQPDELAIHGDAEIPDMRMKITIDIRRNTDTSLPASHLVEVTFKLPPDVAGGKVIASPGILMKFTQQARGTPLVGASAKITDGSFLVGLSGKETDRERNLQLLKERGWFDITMVYANQHRGILAAEKGYHGEDVFNEAMTAWEKSP